MGIGVRVVVDVGDDLPGRRRQPGVARAAQPAVRRVDHPHAEASRDVGGGVGRAVVHDDDLVRRVLQPAQPLQRVADRAGAVVATHDGRDHRPLAVLGTRQLGHHVAHRPQRGLGGAVAPGEAEGPVLDVHTAAVPLVGPGEGERAGHAAGEDAAELRLQAAGLAGLAVAQAVEADLAHEQRAVTGDVVQPGQIGGQPLARFEVDVEADDVEERQLQVLRRRIVHVGDERAGIDLLGRLAPPSPAARRRRRCRAAMAPARCRSARH